MGLLPPVFLEAQLGSHLQRCFSFSKAVIQRGVRKEGAFLLHHFTPALVAFAAVPTGLYNKVFYCFIPALSGFAVFGCFCS